MPKQNPTVAVLLSTHNRANLIGEAIDSLLGQTRPPDELRIIDDGSTDDTQSVVAAYGDRVSLTTQANAGRAAAFNRVIPSIQADYIWLFDDDDIALPHALETHLNFLQDHPECDFTCSPHYFFEQRSQLEEKAILSASQAPEPGNEHFLLWLMRSHFAPTQLQGMLIPRACFETVGLFDEKLLRCQDIDMMLRLAQRFRAGRIAQPTWAFRQHDGVRVVGATTHDAGDRYRVWRKYKLPVFIKLRDALTLAEYLPERSGLDTPDSVLTPSEYRRALLQRAVIMAIHGLHKQAADDFSLFCGQLATAAGPLSEEEQTQVSGLSHIHNLESALPAHYFYRLGRGAHRDKRLFKPMLRGLFWSAKRDLRARRFATLAKIIRSTTTLTAGFMMPGSGVADRPAD